MADRLEELRARLRAMESLGEKYMLKGIMPPAEMVEESELLAYAVSEIERLRNPSVGDVDGQAAAWVAVYKALVDAGMLSFLGSMTGGRNRAVEYIAHMATTIKALRKQLPEGMTDCTIVFKSCPKGHGWLTATNWVQHDCPTCTVEAGRQKLADAEIVIEAQERDLETARQALAVRERLTVQLHKEIEALRKREEWLRDENAKLRGWCAGMIDGLQHILEITADVEHDREIHYHTLGTLTGEQGEVIPASFRELIGVDAAALAAKGDGK